MKNQLFEEAKRSDTLSKELVFHKISSPYYIDAGPEAGVKIQGIGCI